MITEDCVRQLMMFQFSAAAKELTSAADQRERAVIAALAVVFGDSGYMIAGQMDTIVWAAIQSILPDDVARRVASVDLEHEDLRDEKERLIDSLPDDWWTISDILMYLGAVGAPIESSTWGSYVTRGQAPPAERHFGRTGGWRPETIKKWQETRARRGTGAIHDEAQ